MKSYGVILLSHTDQGNAMPYQQTRSIHFKNRHIILHFILHVIITRAVRDRQAMFACQEAATCSEYYLEYIPTSVSVQAS